MPAERYTEGGWTCREARVVGSNGPEHCISKQHTMETENRAMGWGKLWHETTSRRLRRA